MSLEKNCKVSNLILIYAFRYSVQRLTGALSDSIEAIQQNIDNFKDWEFKTIISEIDYELQLNSGNVNKIQLLGFSEYLRGKLNHE